jgi:hypothetical protein
MGGPNYPWSRPSPFLVDGKPTLDPRAQGVAPNEANEKVSLLAVS